MPSKNEALENAVNELLQARTAIDAAPGLRAQVRADRCFARLAALLAPRVRYFTRRYGLSDVAEDAEQACAIALHRAVGQYDPCRARFTTFIDWQIRAELQALRTRLYGDRRSAGRRRVGAWLSLDALRADGADDWLADEEAEDATEAAASDCLAQCVTDRLVDDWARRRHAALSRGTGRGAAQVEARVAAERALVLRRLSDSEAASERLRESDRHIVRRAVADIIRHTRSKPH
ncbi:RNA polymerase subunit sigma-70 [Sphingopyxis sp. DHUNG17]|uniref:sigma factor n=1 Tax=Sphingopyxis jiangsuensis TaxID=2871171 RepID=UPI00191F5070|nr:sigma factor [Sphingopyxis lutea]MBL0769346.1 RNA polymerase subunit sigma-70 [Sphingopyxis lutea]